MSRMFWVQVCLCLRVNQPPSSPSSDWPTPWSWTCCGWRRSESQTWWGGASQKATETLRWADQAFMKSFFMSWLEHVLRRLRSRGSASWGRRWRLFLLWTPGTSCQTFYLITWRWPSWGPPQKPSRFLLTQFLVVTSTCLVFSPLPAAVWISASHPGVCERTESSVCRSGRRHQQQSASQRAGSHPAGSFVLLNNWLCVVTSINLF